MALFFFLLQLFCCIGAIVANLNYNSQTVLTTDDNRIRGIRDSEDRDFVVGALIPVHKSTASGCSENIYVEASDHVEAVLYSLDLINSDSNLLPNISIGYDIRDSCVNENIALEEILDQVLTENAQMCDNMQNDLVPVSTILGAAVSFVSVPVARILRLFRVPQISYSSTSILLSNREEFGYFYRTVPSDDQQIQVMIDLALHFGWTYISTIHSNNEYGEPGINELLNLAADKGICIDLDEGIDDDFTRSDYVSLANRIFNSTANVIVFFASAHHIEGLFSNMLEIQRMTGQKRRFLWIAGDTWAESSDITVPYSEIVAGMWGVIPLTNANPAFFEHVSQLNPSTNKRNPWYIEYYEQYYNCTFNVSCDNTMGSITESPLYRNNTFAQLLIDATFSYAYALDSFLNANCEKPIVWYRNNQTCRGQAKEFIVTGESLLEHLNTTHFNSTTGNEVKFNSHGTVEGRYQVLNFQICNDCSEDERYTFADVAVWDGQNNDNKRLQFNPNISQHFGINETGQPLLGVVQSQCQQCQIGHIRLIQSSCCSTCIPCLGRNYTNTTTSTECSICPQTDWGNNPLNGSETCQSIDEEFLDPSDVWAIVLIVIACFGFIAVVLVSIALGIFWNTPIVKSSGREQMVLLLSGILLCFILTFFFVVKPSIPICLFQRVSTWLCFSLILCSLFVKLVRIARIFLRKHGAGRPRFIEPKYQIMFTLVLIGCQMLLVLISLIVVYPDTTAELVLNGRNTNDFPTLVIKCASPHIVMIILQMLYYTALLIASNALAILTIRFPANFNEVKYVAFSTFSLGLIWLAFIPTFFTTQTEFRAGVLSFTIQMSALAVLACMFGPRIFIMIVFPSKNVTEHFSQSTGEKALSTLNAKRKESAAEYNKKYTDRDMKHTCDNDADTGMKNGHSRSDEINGSPTVTFDIPL